MRGLLWRVYDSVSLLRETIYRVSFFAHSLFADISIYPSPSTRFVFEFVMVAGQDRKCDFGRLSNIQNGFRVEGEPLTKDRLLIVLGARVLNGAGLPIGPGEVGLCLIRCLPGLEAFSTVSSCGARNYCVPSFDPPHKGETAQQLRRCLQRLSTGVLSFATRARWSLLVVLPGIVQCRRGRVPQLRFTSRSYAISKLLRSRVFELLVGCFLRWAI